MKEILFLLQTTIAGISRDITSSREELIRDNFILRLKLAGMQYALCNQGDKESSSSIRHPLIRLQEIASGFRYLLSPHHLIDSFNKRFKQKWTVLSSNGKTNGRPPITKEIRDLIRKHAKENISWGAPRIHGELLKLGIDISERSVSRYMPKREHHGGLFDEWKTFLKLQTKGTAGMDFFTVPTILFRQLYCFFIINHESRKLIYFNVTFHPTAKWVAKQLTKAFSSDHTIKYMIFDHGSQFSPLVISTLRDLGIKSRQTDVRSPWQNGIAERWVGNCRRDLLDHVIIINKRHLYFLVREYMDYYNNDRTHYAREKDTPEGRPVQQRTSDDDKVVAIPRLGGLHHKYVWEKTA